MAESIDVDRRMFLGRAAVGVAVASVIAAQLNYMGVAHAADAKLPSLGPIKQIDAGELNVGYYEAGPKDGPAVLLLHGYPYDIHSYIDVAPLLAAKGCRVIVPHLRGHGSTRFLDAATPRSGQQSAVASDMLALMDALKVDKAVVAGYDWGARTGCIMAALWPERSTGLLTVNGYLIQDLVRNATVPLPAKTEQSWWYQYYFATERGRAGLTANRADIARILWTTNSPGWHYDEATFARTAASFDNPDYVDIVIHNYRWRLSLAPGFPKFEDLEKRLAPQPMIGVRTVNLEGGADGVVPATDGTMAATKFSGSYTHRVIDGAGHNLPQEAPQAFADAVMELVAAGQ
jgi:pimeloyl-ACP methyl ester carboxylesterase